MSGASAGTSANGHPGTSSTTGNSGGTNAAGTVTLGGTAYDSAIPGAIITVTSGAPLGQSGATTIATALANASGAYTATAPIPSGNTAVFINAADPRNANNVFTGYLGQSTDLVSGTTLDDNLLPNLDVGPVTTAAVALYASLHGNSYAGLTRASYTQALTPNTADVSIVAAGLKAVGDALCQPAASHAIANLATVLAAGTSLGSGLYSTALEETTFVLGGNCGPVVETLMQAVSADPIYGPQLAGWSGPNSTMESIAGAYEMQGVIAESGLVGGTLSAQSLAAAPTSTPASVFSDTITIAGGTGSVTSADGRVEGTMNGNVLNLSVKNGGQTYTVRMPIIRLTSALSSSGGYALGGSGQNSSTSVLTNFPAVLVPVGASPTWTGLASNLVQPAASTAMGVTCESGLPMLLHGYVNGVGGGSVGECVSPNATGWTMDLPTAIAQPFGFNYATGRSSATEPVLATPSWTQTESAPFVLTSTASYALSSSSSPTTSGQMYAVANSPVLIFTTASGNNVFRAVNNPLTW
ncbi:MAG TPA: hypothetical protein VHV99_19060 [Paraburkholderia sp.]|nr:hypothetical protein [Paraburkholderia sp.]